MIYVHSTTPPSVVLPGNYTSERWFHRLQILFSFLLWSYIFYRGVFLSLTQDEAHSYLLAKTDNWRQMAGTTNTHWLNTLFVRFMILLPGSDSVWKLRLLSIFSWVVYCWSAHKLSAFLKNKWIGFVFFATLLLNPFILFYFSLERGYAPAFALLLLSLYFACNRIKNNEFSPAKWVKIFFLAALASLANFSAFYFFLALTIVYLGYLIFTYGLAILLASDLWRVWFVVGSITGFTTIALFFVRSRNELYYGGTSLTSSMLGSMMHGSYYINNHYNRYETEGVSYLLSMDVPESFSFLSLVLFISILAAFLFYGFRFIRTKKLTYSFFTLSIFVFILIINGFLHLVLDTPYLFSRTALVLYPILVTAFFFMTNVETNKTLWQKLFAVGLFIFLVSNFYKSFSLKTFIEWPVQTHTEYTLDYLQKTGAKNVGLNAWDYSILENYLSKAYPGRYTFTYHSLPYPEKIESLDKRTTENYDYVILKPPHDKLIMETWELIKVLPYSKTAILKSK